MQYGPLVVYLNRACTVINRTCIAPIINHVISWSRFVTVSSSKWLISRSSLKWELCMYR